MSEADKEFRNKLEGILREAEASKDTGSTEPKPDTKVDKQLSQEEIDSLLTRTAEKGKPEYTFAESKKGEGTSTIEAPAGPKEFIIPEGYVPGKDVTSELRKSVDELHREGLTPYEIPGQTGQFIFRIEDVERYRLAHLRGSQPLEEKVESSEPVQPTTPQNEYTWNFKRAATYLGMEDKELNHLMKLGVFKAVKIGGTFHFKEEDVINYASRDSKPTEAFSIINLQVTSPSDKEEILVAAKPDESPPILKNVDEETTTPTGKPQSIETTLRTILGLKEEDYQMLQHRGLLDVLLMSDAFKGTVKREVTEGLKGYSPEEFKHIETLAESVGKNLEKLTGKFEYHRSQNEQEMRDRLKIAVGDTHQKAEEAIKSATEAGENAADVIQAKLDSARREVRGLISGAQTELAGKLTNSEALAQRTKTAYENTLRSEARVDGELRRRDGRLSQLFSKHPWKTTMLLTGLAALATYGCIVKPIQYGVGKITEWISPPAELVDEKRKRGSNYDNNPLLTEGGKPTGNDDVTVWHFYSDGTKKPFKGYLDYKKGDDADTFTGTRFEKAAYDQEDAAEEWCKKYLDK